MNPKPRRRILWIHPGGLLPVSGGGAARTWALIEYLRRQGFAVELLTGDQGPLNADLEARVDRLWIEQKLASDRNQRPFREPIVNWARRYYRHMDPSLRWLRYLPLRGRIATRNENLLSRNRRPGLETYAGHVAYDDPPLAAIASYAWLAPALDHMPPGTLRILDTIDVQHLRRETAARAGGDLDHVRCSREDEEHALNRADVLLAIQAEEGELLTTMCPDKEVLVTRHALTIPPYTPSPTPSKGLLYVGNLYDPNILGLTRILDRVWPQVRQQCPDATLTICGRVGETVRRPIPGVQVAGHVADLAPFYHDAAVVLNPVPYGTGLKIKTVEALAHGRCVVCSEAGTGGLGPPAQLPVVMTERDEEMCRAIMRLLRDPDARHAMEMQAWDFAQAHFSPDSVYGALRSRLEQHCNATT